MARRVSEQRRCPDDTLRRIANCPSWCVAPHGLHCGEEDWIHISEPVTLTDHVLARLCMTIAPDGETLDGPYVLIGSTELRPNEAHAMGLAIQALASAADAASLRATP